MGRKRHRDKILLTNHLNMHKNIKTTAGLLILLALSVSTSVAFAQMRAPDWQVEQGVDVSAFQYMLEVPPVNISVPTVVEVEVPTAYVVGEALAIDMDGVIVPTASVSRRDVREVPVQIETEIGMSASELSDNEPSTTIEYPFVAGENNTAWLRFVSEDSDEFITSSEIRITLAPNVTLPQTVAVYTNNGGSLVGTVVARRPMSGTVIRFPVTTARTFAVEFEITQPLRLEEATIVQTTDSTLHNNVRFLAQRGKSYTLYIDSDRPYGRVPENGSLLGDIDILGVGTVLPQVNPMYVPVDRDADGIYDVRDNCPTVANPDQRDVDGNAQGDACDDFDRDGVMTVADNCPELPNRDQRDTDHDGIGDVCDVEEDRFTEANPWVPWVGVGIAGLVLVGLMILTVRGKRPDEQHMQSDGEIK